MTALNYPHSLHGLGQRIGHPNLPGLVHRYLHEKVNSNNNTASPPLQPVHINTSHVDQIKIFHSACAIFCAPSNPSTTTGMYHKTIQAMPAWNQGEIPGPRCDCVFILNGTNSGESVMSDLSVAWILLFFSFTFDDELHQCALVHWFSGST